jgi:hypothetical protein
MSNAPTDARVSGEWLAVRVREGSHPWLLLKNHASPSGFYPDDHVAGWAATTLPENVAYGYVRFAAQFPDGGAR